MYAICPLTAVALRKDPNHRSEMVSQLLLGECCTVLETNPEGWLFVRCQHDGYRGWVEQKQLQPIEESVWKEASRLTAFCSETLGLAQPEGAPSRAVLFGSPLVESAGFWYECQRLAALTAQHPIESRVRTLVEMADYMLGAPYLWGGRSPLGVDCSGLMQLLYRFVGIRLPRDAYQQAEEGALVPIDEAHTGDLAFFQNEQGKISHVGMLWRSGEILHAYGEVRVDTFNRKGIFVQEKQTHTLAWVRRLIY